MLAARCFCIEMSEAPRAHVFLLFLPFLARSSAKWTLREAASTKRLSTAETFRASAPITTDNYSADYTFIRSRSAQIGAPDKLHPPRDRFWRTTLPSVIGRGVIIVTPSRVSSPRQVLHYAGKTLSNKKETLVPPG